MIESQVLDGTYVPIPIAIQGDEPVPDFDRYNEAYPDDHAIIRGAGRMQGYDLGSVEVFPLMYLGESNQLVLAKRLQVTRYLRAKTAQELASEHRRLRPDTRPASEHIEYQWIQRQVANPDQFLQHHRIDRRETRMSTDVESPLGGFLPSEMPSLTSPRVELVVITDSVTVGGAAVGDLVSEFQKLADWRTESGVPAVVRTVGWIDEHYVGVDRPEKIREFVREASSLWGTRFICLGGDVEIVPPRVLGGPTTYNGARPDQPTDSYYAELDATWNVNEDAYWINNSWINEFGGDGELLDIYVGRLPVRTEAEAADITRKILEYERTPDYGLTPGSYTASYYNDFVVAAGLTNSAGWQNPENALAQAEAWLDSLEAASTYSLDVTRMYPQAPDTYEDCDNVSTRCYDDLYTFLDTTTTVAFSGSALRQRIDSGTHLVFHQDHSFRQFLGSLSKVGDETCGEQAFSDECLTDFVAANPGAFGDHFTKEQVDHLKNGPDYSVVLSAGSYTSQWEMDSVAEHFLRCPTGGAVAYIGKNQSPGYFPTLWREFLLGRFVSDVEDIGVAFGLALNSISSNAVTSSVTCHLLGDPSMPTWAESPGTLTLTQTPSTITSLGPQTILITVKDGLANVQGARVCIKQGDLGYAVAWTNSSGVARFPSFNVASEDSTTIVAVAPDYVPKEDLLKFGSVATAHNLIYDRHSIQYDSNSDELLDAGEDLQIRVLATDAGSNQGQTASTYAFLWPTAPMVFDIDIEGEYVPENILIGGQEATPPAVQDTFRVPTTWEAVRTEMEPQPSTTGRLYAKVWRDTTGLYHLSAEASGTTSDSLISGTIRTVGAFSDTTTNAETSGEDMVSFSETEISFSLMRDATVDEILFRADYGPWMAVSTDSVAMGTFAAGDTASAAFSVSTAGTLPDGERPVFTLAVRDDDRNWWFSDFVESAKAPVIRPISLEKTFAGSGPVTMDMDLVIANTGGAVADSATATLYKSAGTATVVSSVVTFGSCAPGDTLAGNEAFVLTAASEGAHADLEFDLELQLYFPNGDSTEWSRDGLDVVAPSAVTGVIIDELDGSIVIRWDGVSASDLEGYHVFRETGGTRTRLTRIPLSGTTRFEASGLEATSGGSYVDHVYSVAAVDSSGNQGPLVETEAGNVRLPELAGWPQKIPSGAQAALKAADVDGDGKLEVFAAGTKMYAWNHDGTPLISGNSDGLFFIAASFLYRTVAVADVVPDTAGLEIVQAVSNPAR